ncbi:MAG: pentapeptide MXKDX repeat protein [Actinomycetota bacterium]
MRKRLPAALVAVGALTLAACGDDDGDSTDTTVATTEAASGDEMSEDEMSEDDMSEDEMSEDEMSEDEMSEDDMSEDDMSEDEMAEADGTVVDIAVARDDLTVLVAALQATGLDAALAEAGPFTIFAPTDAAFEAYLGEMGLTADDVLADVDATAVLLQGHVVAVADDASMVASMTDTPFVTLAGTELPVTVDGDTVTIGGATIIETDLFGTNGVIHIIDTVLEPA